MATGLVYHSLYLKHEAPGGHPEQPDRLRSIMARLEKTGLLSGLIAITPAEAGLSWIERVHTKEHITRLQKSVSGYLDADTFVNSFSYTAALTACGGAIAAVDAVMTGEAANVFCALRPPGHHAESNRAMGFCLFNNVAVAARYAQKKYTLKKIFIIDWDVHHGNGTQEIFWNDPDVFYVSLHQWPLYPGTGRAEEIGEGAGKGFTQNYPLPPGSGDAQYLAAFETIQKTVERFKPELIMISAGFDAHAQDPLAQMNVSTEGFAAMTQRVKTLAQAYCSSRIVSVLEGGYHLPALAESVEAHIRVLADV